MPSDLERYKSLISEYTKIPKSGILPPTLLEITGQHYKELVFSNLLSFFLDERKEHGLKDLFLTALLEAYDSDIMKDDIVIDVRTEEKTDKNNRIDLLIETDKHVIGIENKVYAKINNDLKDYSEYINEVSKKNGNKRKEIKILLTLRELAKEERLLVTETGFKVVRYSELIERIRTNIGDYIFDAESRYVMLLYEFINTIYRLERGPQMDDKFVQFVSDNEKEINELYTDTYKFKGELRAMVKSLQNELYVRNVFSATNIHYAFWRDPYILEDYLAIEISINESLKIVIDCIVSAKGWRFTIFNRHGNILTVEVENYIQNKRLPSFTRHDDRGLLDKKFSFGEEINVVADAVKEWVGEIVAG